MTDLYRESGNVVHEVGRETAGAGWNTVNCLDLHLSVPGDWEVLQVPGAVVLAHPVMEGFFRPNLVVRRAGDQRPLPVLSAEALKAVLLALDSCHVLANDPVSLAGRPARAQRFVYDAGGHSIVAERWLVADEGTAIELTASYSVVQSHEMRRTLRAMATSLEVLPFTGVPAPPFAPAGRPPRLDSYASAMLGQPLETLDRFSTGQHYRSEGPLLSMGTVNFLAERADESGLGRLEWGSYPLEVAELKAAGLMTATGRFSDELRAYLVPLRTSRFTVQGSAEHRGRGTHLTLWVGSGAALVAAGASHAELVNGQQRGSVPEGKVRLDLVGLEGVPGVVASWAGIAPAYSIAATDQEVAPARLQARFEAQVPAPATADAALERMWEQPWFRWSWRIEPLGMGADLLNAGAAGHYLPEAADNGNVLLGPLGAGALWDGLVDAYLAALAGIPQRRTGDRA